MAELNFNQVTLSYPIYNSRSMSLRNQFMRIATGGIIESESGHTTIVTALKEVSFQLKDGDSVGLIGHNGAGKSTLLRTMAGIYQPEKGSIIRQGKVATVFEIGAGLEPELSGYENVFNLGMMLGLSYQQANDLLPDIETFTELGDFLQLPVRTYSSGMTMRLMFAVATAITPEILLIDEMFSAGDASFQEKSRLRLQRLISSAKIFVFASHDHDLLRYYCNRIFQLNHGFLTEIPFESF
jgi:ABC-type polysaccharide/polyol phosphate transport system ATPase subunit